MSTQSLVSFLNKLDKELRASSEDYRRITANRYTHTFDFRVSTLIKTLKDLVEQAVNLEGKTWKQLITSSMQKQLRKELAYVVEESRKQINKLSTKKDVTVVWNRGGRTGNLTMNVTISTPVGSNRDIFNSIKNTYTKNLNNAYKNFLDMLNVEFIARSTTSSKANTSVLVKQGSDAFALEHTQSSSNIKAFIEDKIYTAFNQVNINTEDELLTAAGSENINLNIVKRLASVDNKSEVGEISVFVGSTRKNIIESKTEGSIKRDLLDKIEADLKKILRKYQDNIVDMPGSDSLSSAHRKKIIKAATTPFKTSRSSKVKTEDLALKGATSSAKLTKKVLTSKAKVKTRKLAQQKLDQLKKDSVSNTPLAIIREINLRLPEQIARNMGYPALEYRTGRFAQSAQILNVDTTTQGFPSFAYTYMKGPYQTFEPGYRQGSVERDPRRLIDMSIRQLAIEFGLGRLYTKRI